MRERLYMERSKIKICVMRVGGTNRDADAAACIEDLGANVEIVHLNDILRRRNLATYNGLIFPGGFAYGDYIRAGAIWAKRLMSFLKEDLRQFADSGKPILGICNGFQVLVEAGLLPGFERFDEPQRAALAGNVSGRFECRWAFMKKNPESKCVFTTKARDVVRFPVAHGEGRFIVPDGDETLKRLIENNQIVFQYSDQGGKLAGGSYPKNPNGSTMDIAGICSPSGTIFGLMPHPEDAYWWYQLPDWSGFIPPQNKEDGGEATRQMHGDGRAIFESMLEYIQGASGGTASRSSAVGISGRVQD